MATIRKSLQSARVFSLVSSRVFLRNLTSVPPPAPAPVKSSSSSSLLWGILIAAGGLAAYSQKETLLGPTKTDYQQVYNDIAEMLESPDYDDGSYGPVLIRLAWHACGTYDKNTKTGGSNGATMRFAPESAHGANAGLSVARALLEKVKAKHPGISYADLWSLGGVVAVQEMVCFTEFFNWTAGWTHDSMETGSIGCTFG